MRRILLTTLLAVCVFATGCAKVNPRMDQKLDNTNGKIDSIKNNQNGIQADIGNLKQNADIQNSKLKEIQQGVLNMNAALSRNENTGVQILQGDGALIMVFGLGVVGMLLWYFHGRATTAEKAADTANKAADIMAAEIARHGDPTLQDNVLRSAMNSESEAHVYHLLAKHNRLVAKSRG